MTDDQLTKFRDKSLGDLIKETHAELPLTSGEALLIKITFNKGFDAAVKLMRDEIAELIVSRDRSKLFHSTELDRGDKLRQVLADYREVLEFYGDKKHFIKRPYIDNELIGDDGFKAREVLAKHKDVKSE